MIVRTENYYYGTKYKGPLTRFYHLYILGHKPELYKSCPKCEVSFVCHICGHEEANSFLVKMHLMNAHNLKISLHIKVTDGLFPVATTFIVKQRVYRG